MSNKRGKRGSSKPKFAVQLKIRDEGQLLRTLNLSNIHGDKPHVNDIMPIIVERLDAEEYAASLALARSWQRGWSARQMLYECMGEDYPGFDDEEYGYDDLESLYDGVGHKGSRKIRELNKKLFKKGRHSSKSKHRGSEDDDFWANRSTMFRNGEWSDDITDEDYDSPYKCIKFYPDIEDEFSVKEFDSLKAFSDFCEENGYRIGTIDYNNLLNNSVTHCCLDPISKEYGENEIITDNSYGALFWTVSEDITKHEELSHEPHYEDALGARTLTD